MKNMLVFCGSSPGHNPIYQSIAKELGKHLAENNMRLIYGGGNVGLMGLIANACLDNGGEVTGIIPHFLAREVPKLDVTELIFVETMLERKQLMAQKSDAVIALPGGFGTLDELFEELTARQLGFHKRPIGLLNINNFFGPLLSMMEKMVEEGFLKPENKNLLFVSEKIVDLLALMKSNTIIEKLKWVS